MHRLCPRLSSLLLPWIRLPLALQLRRLHATSTPALAAASVCDTVAGSAAACPRRMVRAARLHPWPLRLQLVQQLLFAANRLGHQLVGALSHATTHIPQSDGALRRSECVGCSRRVRARVLAGTRVRAMLVIASAGSHRRRHQALPLQQTHSKQRPKLDKHTRLQRASSRPLMPRRSTQPCWRR
jgi:hypothetical protein